jgi:hypothetical protein
MSFQNCYNFEFDCTLKTITVEKNRDSDIVFPKSILIVFFLWNYWQPIAALPCNARQQLNYHRPLLAQWRLYKSQNGPARRFRIILWFHDNSCDDRECFLYFCFLICNFCVWCWFRMKLTFKLKHKIIQFQINAPMMK